MPSGDRAFRYRPFHFRAVTSDAGMELAGQRLKVYRVTQMAVPFDASRFTELPRLLRSALRRNTSPEAGRPGVGFVITHQAATCDYIVLVWWDRENELPMRVWGRDDGRWRDARGGESVCVWDLEVIWHERNAGVETALSGMRIGTAVEDYMTRQFRSVSRS
ncbi:MAG TPA: hypothetical protein VFO19_00730 [Vicinamibacterales bacterium]|nr:hypothetical protein [Vicinamibacterales bacterium]